MKPIRPCQFSRVLTLGLLLTLTSACLDVATEPVDSGLRSDATQPAPMTGDSPGRCTHLPAVRYRLDTLHIPTVQEAASGQPAGHDLDAMGGVCSVPDYPGDVDNAFIEIAAGLRGLAEEGREPIDLQGGIDNALACAAGSSDCTRLDLFLSIATGVGCASVSIENGAGEALTTPFLARVDSSGHMWAHVAGLPISIPYAAQMGTVGIDLALSGVTVTATIGENALTDIVIGGVLERPAFEAVLGALLPLLGEGLTLEELLPILSTTYDVESGGACSAQSVGLIGSATAE